MRDRKAIDGAGPEAVPSRALRRAVVAGLAATGVLSLVLAVLSTSVTGLPFAPVAIAQRLVRVTSGSVNAFFISRLGYWAARLALLGTCIAFALSGAVLGVAVAALRRRGVGAALWWVALSPLWVASVVLYVEYPRNVGRLAFAALTFPAYGFAGWFGGWLHGRLAGPGPPAQPDFSRRWILRSVLLGGAGVALGAANLSRLIYRRPDPGQQRLQIPNLIARPEPRILTPGDAAFADIPGLTPEITSVARHYVIDEELIDPDIDPATWRLKVFGLVDRPLQLSYGELRAMPTVQRYHTLECISNEVGGHLMSTARWTGVPLPLILERAGVKPGALEVVFFASGGYSDSLSIEQAMDDTTLVAIGMNGYVLPRAHGFPARLLSAGTYGMKNPKWLEGIALVDQPYLGFWEQRGWSKQAIVRTDARIDVPVDPVKAAEVATVAGVAVAGDRGVSTVEVSTDGGRTWNRADLKTPLGAHTWRLWMYRWVPPAPGQYTALVRATDGNGEAQAPREMDTFPSGATGYDSVEVTATWGGSDE